MLIPGVVVTLVTFPGVIFHELGHQLFCLLTGVKIKEVCYFRFGNPSGYVLHEEAVNFRQVFFITVGPFISGSLLAILCFIFSKVFPAESFLRGLFTWLGISIAMHSFPSSSDAGNLWRESNVYVKRMNLTALLGYPFALIIWLANLLSVIWFDLIYAASLYMLVTR